MESRVVQPLRHIAWLSAKKCQLDRLAERLPQNPWLVANLERQQQHAPRNEHPVKLLEKLVQLVIRNVDDGIPRSHTADVGVRQVEFQHRPAAERQMRVEAPRLANHVG